MRKVLIGSMATMMMIVLTSAESSGRGPGKAAGRTFGGAGSGRAGFDPGVRGGDGRSAAGKFNQGPSLGSPNELRSTLDASKLQERTPQANDQWRSRAQNWADYAPQSQPFTAQWYRDHPYAGQATHPHADAWAAASFAAAAAWVGLAATQPAVYESYVGVAETTKSSPSNPNQVNEASELAAGGLNKGADDAWLPLGVYGLVQEDQTEANLLLQLVVNKSGALAGTYYDVLSDSGHKLQGSADLKSQRVAWSVGANKGAVFETTLGNLGRQRSSVLVHFPNGRTQRWTLVRKESPRQPQGSVK